MDEQVIFVFTFTKHKNAIGFVYGFVYLNPWKFDNINKQTSLTS